MDMLLPPKYDKNIPLLTTVNLSDDAEAVVLYTNFVVEFAHKNRISHSHSFYEFHIALKNTGILRYGNNESVVLKEKDGILIPPGRLHNLESCEDGYYVLALAFNLNIANVKEVVPKTFSINDKQLQYLVQLIKEYDEHRIGYKSAMDSAISMFFIDILRELDIINDFDQTKIKSNQPLNIALGFIKNNIDHRITANDVAAATFLSTRHLNRIFVANFNKSVTQYIKDAKLSLAKDYLRKTNFSIKEIAYLAGLESDSYFCKLFKREYGISPNAYREEWGTYREDDENDDVNDKNTEGDKNTENYENIENDKNIENIEADKAENDKYDV